MPLSRDSRDPPVRKFSSRGISCNYCGALDTRRSTKLIPQEAAHLIAQDGGVLVFEVCVGVCLCVAIFREQRRNSLCSLFEMCCVIVTSANSRFHL